MKSNLLLNFVLIFVVLVQQVVYSATIDNNIEDEWTMEEKWFETYLDHFNIWDNRTFLLRYFENNDFFEPGGPLLLEIGSETTADPDSLIYSPSYNLSRRLHGKLVLLEHRYYGESSPFENFTTENLMYLNVEQALEDLVFFIDSYKKMTPGLKNSKVVAFGCSYSAALATWLRYKFPHLIDAAWASSGPLHATLDFYQYYEVAGEMYANVSSECIAIIRQGYREAKKLLSTPEGLEENRAAFEGWECGNVTDLDAEDILSYTRAIVADQYNKPSHALESCRFLQSKNRSTTCFQQLAAFVVNKSEDVCFEEEESNDYLWRYQTCTEFGYSFTTSSPNQPFKDTYSAIDADLESCAEDFGDELTKEALQRSIDRINRVYGSTDLQVTKVLTVHGTHDPWHRIGLYQEKNREAPVLLIPGTSHCADMSTLEDELEPRRLTAAKKKGMFIIEQWLR